MTRHSGIRFALIVALGGFAAAPALAGDWGISFNYRHGGGHYGYPASTRVYYDTGAYYGGCGDGVIVYDRPVRRAYHRSYTPRRSVVYYDRGARCGSYRSTKVYHRRSHYSRGYRSYPVRPYRYSAPRHIRSYPAYPTYRCGSSVRVHIR